MVAQAPSPPAKGSNEASKSVRPLYSAAVSKGFPSTLRPKRRPPPLEFYPSHNLIEFMSLVSSPPFSDASSSSGAAWSDASGSQLDSPKHHTLDPKTNHDASSPRTLASCFSLASPPSVTTQNGNDHACTSERCLGGSQSGAPLDTPSVISKGSYVGEVGPPTQRAILMARRPPWGYPSPTPSAGFPPSRGDNWPIQDLQSKRDENGYVCPPRLRGSYADNPCGSSAQSPTPHNPALHSRAYGPPISYSDARLPGPPIDFKNLYHSTGGLTRWRRIGEGIWEETFGDEPLHADADFGLEQRDEDDDFYRSLHYFTAMHGWFI